MQQKKVCVAQRRNTANHTRVAPTTSLHQPLVLRRVSEKYDHHERSTAVTHVILPLQGAACFARPPALLNYGAIPPPGAAALLCPLTAGGASRLVPERDPGIHAPAGGATAGGPAH